MQDDDFSLFKNELRDYQSLLKPALLTTADNGVLICCNNLAIRKIVWETRTGSSMRPRP